MPKKHKPEKLTRRQKIKIKTQKFKHEFRKQLIIAVLAAFGFLIALSWRDFISESVNHITSSLNIEQLYLAKLLSAITVTLLAVLGILIATKFKVEE